MLNLFSSGAPVAWTTWPHRPEPPGDHDGESQCFSLLRISDVPRSPSGRVAVREISSLLLSEWTGFPVCLKESERGPVVEQTINGRPCFLSISYAGNCAWVAIALGAPVGVDAVEVEAFEQLLDVADLYLATTDEPNPSPAVEQALQFAKRWTAMEARFKRAGLPIEEHTVPPEATVSHIVHENTVVAVAFLQFAGPEANSTRVRTPNPVAPKASP